MADEFEKVRIEINPNHTAQWILPNSASHVLPALTGWSHAFTANFRAEVSIWNAKASEKSFQPLGWTESSLFKMRSYKFKASNSFQVLYLKLWNFSLDGSDR